MKNLIFLLGSLIIGTFSGHAQSSKVPNHKPNYQLNSASLELTETKSPKVHQGLFHHKFEVSHDKENGTYQMVAGQITGLKKHPVHSVILTLKNGQEMTMKFDAHHQSLDDQVSLLPIFIDPENSIVSVVAISESSAKPILELRLTQFFEDVSPVSKGEADPVHKSFQNSNCNCASPSFESRSDWGCPEPVSSWNPVNTTPSHLIVHHEAPGIANPNQAPDWSVRVLGIWDYHTYSNNWGDIGYNWLIDPNGVVYEGRYTSSSNDPIGAHFCGMNSATTGICLLGDYETGGTPTPEALDKLAELMAWKCCEHDIEPTEASIHSGSSLTMYNVAGHISGCSTACPGINLLNELPDLRTATLNLLNSCDPSACTLDINQNSGFPICAGDTYTLTALNGTAPYIWTGIDVGTQQGATISVPAIYGSQEYSVTDANGCSSTTVVNLTQAPVITTYINPPNGIINQGQSATLSVTVNSDLNYSIEWSQVSPFLDLGSSQSILVSPSSTTLYEVQVENSLGCSSSETMTIDVQSVEQLPDLVPNPPMLCNDAGDIIVMDIDIVNLGNVDSGPFTVEYGLIIPESQTFAASAFVTFGNLSPNASESQVLDIDLTSNIAFWEVPKGTYELGFQIDGSDAVTEIDNTNNFFKHDCVIEVAPDLTPINIWTQTNEIQVGSPVAFQFDIANLGETSYTGLVPWNVELSDTPVSGTGDIIFNNSGDDVGTLHASESHPATFSVLDGSNFTTNDLGLMYLIFKVDPSNLICELDETINNCLIYQVNITDGGPCLNNEVASIQSPSDGESICALNQFQTYFYLNSANCSSCVLSWDMGDGNTVFGDGIEYTYDEPGTYVITLTRTYPNCPPSTDQVTVHYSTAEVVVSSIEVDPCSGLSDIYTLAINGEPTMEYHWIGAGSDEHNPDLLDVYPGTYTLFYAPFGFSGCDADIEVVVPENSIEPLTIEEGIIIESSCGSNSGGATVTVAGGNPPYEFQWSNGSLAQDLTNVTNGTYTLDVVDSEGCTGTITVDIPNYCEGCTDLLACNYNSLATVDDLSCLYVAGCTDSNACNYDPQAECDDGSCDVGCTGCTLPFACNYNVEATIDDGSCEFLSCAGCLAPTACNYDSSATIDDGSCYYPDCDDPVACDYNPDALCGGGLCDYSCHGCTYPSAINFDESATVDDGSCLFDECCENPGCTYSAAENYDSNADCDNGSCVFNSCPSDSNGDGVVNTADLLIFLGDFGSTCP